MHSGTHKSVNADYFLAVDGRVFLLTINKGRKTKMKKICKTTLVAILAASVATPALAGQWVKSISIKRDGIDMTPIEVNANANGYTNVKTSSHKFRLQMTATSAKNKRLVAGMIGSYNGVNFFEGSHSKYWDKKVEPKVLKNGGEKKIGFTYTPTIAVSKVFWTGGTPVEVCQKHMNKHAKTAAQKKAFLTKTHTISAMATFQFAAVAAKKKAAKKKSWHVGNTSSRKSSYLYSVNVKCLPGIKTAQFNPS